VQELESSPAPRHHHLSLFQVSLTGDKWCQVQRKKRNASESAAFGVVLLGDSRYGTHSVAESFDF